MNNVWHLVIPFVNVERGFTGVSYICVNKLPGIAQFLPAENLSVSVKKVIVGCDAKRIYNEDILCR